MNVINLSTRIDRDNFYKSYLEIMNGVLKLSRTELTVLACFMEIKDNNLETGRETFSPATRLYVRELLGISEFNLNNYIKMLKDKKLLFLKAPKLLDISPKIFKPKDSTSITFKLEL